MVMYLVLSYSEQILYKSFSRSGYIVLIFQTVVDLKINGRTIEEQNTNCFANKDER